MYKIFTIHENVNYYGSKHVVSPCTNLIRLSISKHKKYEQEFSSFIVSKIPSKLEVQNHFSNVGTILMVILVRDPDRRPHSLRLSLSGFEHSTLIPMNTTSEGSFCEIETFTAHVFNISNLSNSAAAHSGPAVTLN